MTYLVLLAAFLGASPRSSAQNPYEFWSRLNVDAHLDSHWVVGGDIMYRRQSDYLSHGKDLFQYDLAFIERLWVYYKLPDEWTVVSSPIAYYRDETLKDPQGNLSATHELRSLLGVSKGYTLGKFQNTNRVLYEFSNLNYATPQNFLRHRYRLFNSLEFPISKGRTSSQISYYLFNELFYKTQKGFSSFDQDHVFNGIKWKRGNAAWIVGYQYDHQKSGASFLNKNQFLVSVNLTIAKRIPSGSIHH
ncbi:MAG: DUF2490 domain-containing protein [Bacteroidota bacterium]|nr:DUF2490 domain-containing protein [Bacteroidota bacterium]